MAIPQYFIIFISLVKKVKRKYVHIYAFLPVSADQLLQSISRVGFQLYPVMPSIFFMNTHSRVMKKCKLLLSLGPPLLPFKISVQVWPLQCVKILADLFFPSSLITSFLFYDLPQVRKFMDFMVSRKVLGIGYCPLKYMFKS